MRECAAQYATVGVPNVPPTEGSCRSASGLARVSEAQPSQIIHRVFSKVPVNSHPTNEPWASAVGGCTVRLLVQLSVGRRGGPDPDILPRDKTLRPVDHTSQPFAGFLLPCYLQSVPADAAPLPVPVSITSVNSSSAGHGLAHLWDQERLTPRSTLHAALSPICHLHLASSSYSLAAGAATGEVDLSPKGERSGDGTANGTATFDSSLSFHVLVARPSHLAF